MPAHLSCQPHETWAIDTADTATLLGRMLSGGRSTRLRAGRLLADAGSLRALMAAVYRGVGVGPLAPGERERLAAAFELGQRALVERRPGVRLTDAPAVVARFRDLALADVEVLVAVGLDAGGRAVCEQRLVGGVDGVHARPRDLLRPVLAAGAVALLAVHNHPSGTPEPSAADVAFTRRLAEAARLCGLAFVDHVVIATGGWSSMRDRGLLDATDGGASEVAS